MWVSYSDMSPIQCARRGRRLDFRRKVKTAPNVDYRGSVTIETGSKYIT